MEANRINEFLITVISEESGVEASTIRLDDNFSMLGIDSLDFALILQRAQQEFGEVNKKAASKCGTVGDLCNLFQIAVSQVQ